MKNLVVMFVVCLAGATASAADVCSVIVNNNPKQQILKDMKFSGAYEEEIELMQSAEFSVSVYATGGHFFGISVYDKTSGSVISTGGQDITLASKNGIGLSEKLRVMCFKGVLK